MNSRVACSPSQKRGKAPGAGAAEGAGATALGTPVLGAGTAEAVAAVAASPVGLNNFINPMD